MRSNPLRGQWLLAGVLALAPFGAALAGDIYDDIRALQQQIATEARHKASTSEPPPPPAYSPANDAAGAQGPIRTDMPAEAPAAEPAAPPAETLNQPSPAENEGSR